MFIIIANLLCIFAFFLHAIGGDLEIQQIRPDTKNDNFQKQQYWTMARCGWHWISFDLLAASVLLTLINFGIVLEDADVILQLLAIYFSGYGLFWLLTILFSKPFPKNWLYLGQWMLLWVISTLIYLGR